MASLSKNPIQGVGLSLRACHYADILTNRPPVPWFEVITENYWSTSPVIRQNLMQIREQYPLALHGVSLSLGSTDPLNPDYLRKLRELTEQFSPAHISDHLSWSSWRGEYFHELLPLPYTESVILHVADRISQVQDALGRSILIENVSSYFTYQQSTLPEWAFIDTIAERADCGILLDVNNVYVSACNHGFDPKTYIDSLNPKRIRQIHLAGFQDRGTHLLDTHGAIVHEAVWDLYRYTIQRLGAIPTNIEWDQDIPEFSVLWDQASIARQIIQDAQKVALCH